MDPRAEWIETDGLGGFAAGTVSGIRTRRYHALLLTATTPPTGRMVLVNGCDAWVETPAGRFALSSQCYAPGVTHPDGAERIADFGTGPWPHWRYDLPDGIQIEQEIFVRHGLPLVAVSWRLTELREDVLLYVRPFFSGRDYHSLHHENSSFQFEPTCPDGSVGQLLWRPYAGVPGILVVTNAAHCHQPDWYRNFLYEEERERRVDDTEDLATPGLFRWVLSQGEAVWILAAQGDGIPLVPPQLPAAKYLARLRAAEKKRRSQFASRLHRAADAYLVRRGEGKTVVAGYPWFGDWGRDTFIALRGLCLATGRLDEARAILVEWAGSVSDGMLPNRFPDQGDVPEYNSVDASLWYVIAVHEFLQAMAAAKRAVAPRDRTRLRGAIEAILCGYARGTRYGIRQDEDGLLASGAPGVQLTWMDAKVGDWVVTPRIGKPVEVQALWLNALRIGSEFSNRWEEALASGTAAFRTRFWNEAANSLYDVVDADHHPGTVDAAMRPNQIFAVGGLPYPLLEKDRARAVVDAVEATLWTPLGLRSLAPGDPGYCSRYEGDVRERDGAYHQGTVWPWLLGPFVEAWVRVRGNSTKAKCEARTRFLTPLLRHLDEAGLGHVSEIADAEPPHRPRGCPFQAWSVGEALRLDRVVLAPGNAAKPKSPRRKRT
jgi:predicted glycogen debranching enzyme